MDFFDKVKEQLLAGNMVYIEGEMAYTYNDGVLYVQEDVENDNSRRESLLHSIDELIEDMDDCGDTENNVRFIELEEK